MLSARSLYSGDLECYRRSERGLQIATGQNPSLTGYCTSSSSSRRQSPATELETKSVSSQRKRVPVACERCRKRKIKCSGDEGGGQGCVNCRNAGYDGCQFLRVQSFSAMVNTNVVGAVRSWPSSSRYHPYSHHANRSSSQIHTQPTYHPVLPPYSMWTTNPDFTNYQNSAPSSSWNRTSYTTQYPLQFENESPEPYASSAPPSYMLPNPEPVQNMTMAYLSTLNRPHQSSAWLDQINNIPIAQSTGQLLSTYDVTLAGSPPIYTTMNPINHSVTASERLFPSAAGLRCLPSTSITNNDPPPMSATSHRSSVGWHTETASDTSGTSSNTSCSGQQGTASTFNDPVCTTQGPTYTFSHPLGSSQAKSTTQLQPVAADNPQLQALTRETRSPTTSQQHVRSQSQEIPQSSCTDSPTYSYPYCEVITRSQRSHGNGDTSSAAVNNTYQWMASDRSSKSIFDESPQSAIPERQTQLPYSPHLRLEAQQKY